MRFGVHIVVGPTAIDAFVAAEHVDLPGDLVLDFREQFFVVAFTLAGIRLAVAVEIGQRLDRIGMCPIVVDRAPAPLDVRILDCASNQLFAQNRWPAATFRTVESPHSINAETHSDVTAARKAWCEPGNGRVDTFRPFVLAGRPPSAVANLPLEENNQRRVESSPRSILGRRRLDRFRLSVFPWSPRATAAQKIAPADDCRCNRPEADGQADVGFRRHLSQGFNG